MRAHRTHRTYSADVKAQAIGLALSIGPVKAARELGLPARSVARWRLEPEAQALRTATREAMIDKLWSGFVSGVEEVLAGLRDPAARLSDKAQALRIVAEQWALLSGAVTSRTEISTSSLVDGLSDSERLALRDLLEALPAGGEVLPAELGPGALVVEEPVFTQTIQSEYEAVTWPPVESAEPPEKAPPSPPVRTEPADPLLRNRLVIRVDRGDDW